MLGMKRFAVIGNNMLMNLLYGYTIRKAAGPDAEIYCLFDRNTEVMMKGEGVDALMKQVFSQVCGLGMYLVKSLLDSKNIPFSFLPTEDGVEFRIDMPLPFSRVSV